MTKQFLILDFETRATADLKAVGAYNYALHPSTQILCAAWRVGTKETLRKAPVKCWSPAFRDSDAVQELVDGLLDSSLIVVAHNAAFERVIIENVLSRKFPELKGLPVERFKCTAAQAAALALPRDLEGACAALKLPIQKDMEGRRLILKYCKPRRPTENNPALWHQKASDLRRIMEYCRNDILAETELFLSAPELSEAEHKVWLLDQRINDRGFKCDRAFVESALEVIKKEIPRLEKEARNITGIADLTLNQVAVILAWLKTQGLVIPNLQAKTVDDVLKAGGMPPKPTRVLELRRLASKSSTKKYRAFLNQMGPDDRARGTLLYHGASTGRWCLPRDVECLTPTGWVPISEIGSNQIAVWCPKSKKIEFEHPKKVHVFPFAGDMLRINNRNLVIQMTPEHKIPVFSSRGNLRANSAQTEFGRRVTIPVSGGAGENIEKEDLKTRILVMVQADGHYTRNLKKGAYLCFRFVKIRKIRRCKRLLRKASIPFKTYPEDNVTRISILLSAAPAWLRDFRQKTFSYSQGLNLKSLVDELPHWDSHRAKGMSSFEYSTTNRSNAVFAQTAAHLNGFAARLVTRERQNKKWRTSYRIYVRRAQTARIPGEAWTKEPYSGPVYCPETSTGFFMVKYKNSISVTGNSGRGIQPQNFPRTKLKSLDLIHHWVHTRDPETVDAFWRPPLETLSKTLRSVIKTDKTFFGGDFSAIEARVLFWLSGHAAGLRAYHEGRDLYREIAAVIYNVKLEEVTSEQREIGKRALLGCLAEDTEVITSNGVKQIQNISKGDLLWNGQKWVTHEGVLRKGLKTVIKPSNLNTELTPDHWILTENGWRTAGETAISGGTLPLKLGPKTEGSKSHLTSLKKAVSGVSVYAACAELKKNVELINFGSEKICCVAGVRSPFAVKKGDDPETAAFWLIGNLENVGTLVSTTLEKDVSEILTKTGTGMAVAEFESSSNPFANFWNTLLHSMGLTNPFSRWTELITTGTMPPETYESLTKALTTKTVETYDIAEVADGNRFALADGTLVHNCGYGMGHKKFKMTCEQFGVLVSEELAQHAVNVYRDVHFPVPAFWKLVESAAIAAVKNPGQVFNAGEKIKLVCGPRFLFAILPSGRRLAYAFPRIKYEPAPWGEKFPRLYFWSVHPKTKKWTEGGTYGGALVENLTQATARDLMVNAMQICERAGYETLLTVHDEILTEHQNGSLEEIEKLMTEVPKWASGCPVAVSVWSDKRYNKG